MIKGTLFNHLIGDGGELDWDMCELLKAVVRKFEAAE